MSLSLSTTEHYGSTAKTLLKLVKTYSFRELTHLFPYEQRIELIYISEQAIAAGLYIRMVYKDGTTHLGFVIGKAKVAP